METHIIKNKFIIIVVLFVTIIFFLKMNNIYLGQDEAETAIIAKNVLKFGYPTAWDGRNLVTQNNGIDFNEQYVWTWHSWFQHYLTAMSFLLLGTSTFSARLPFVILGILSVILFYFLSRRISGDETIARISTVLFATSIPFIIHVRQSRYYSLLSFATIWMLYSYMGMLQNKKRNRLQFILSSAMLFHSNYLVFFGTFAGILLYHLILEHREYDKKRFLKMMGALSGILILTLPWYLYANVGEKASITYLFFSLPFNAAAIIYDVNYLVPLLLWPLIFYMLLKKGKKEYLLPFSIIACLTLFLSLGQYRFRYLIGIIPLFYLLLAHTIKNINDKNKIIAGGVLMLLIFTNVFSALPFMVIKNVTPLSLIKVLNENPEKLKIEKPKMEYVFLRYLQIVTGRKPAMKILDVRSPFFDYIYEITHDYDGPNEGIVKYLQEHGSSDDTILTNYGHEPIIFYTDMRVVNRIVDNSSRAYDLTFVPYDSVDWVIIRKDWKLWRKGWTKRHGDFVDNVTMNYERIIIDYPDIPWGNFPEPSYHKFRTVENEEKVVIYKRPRGVSDSHN